MSAGSLVALGRSHGHACLPVTRPPHTEDTWHSIDTDASMPATTGRVTIEVCKVEVDEPFTSGRRRPNSSSCRAVQDWSSSYCRWKASRSAASSSLVCQQDHRRLQGRSTRLLGIRKELWKATGHWSHRLLHAAHSGASSSSQFSGTGTEDFFGAIYSCSNGLQSA